MSIRNISIILSVLILLVLMGGAYANDVNQTMDTLKINTPDEEPITIQNDEITEIEKTNEENVIGEDEGDSLLNTTQNDASEKTALGAGPSTLADENNLKENQYEEVLSEDEMGDFTLLQYLINNDEDGILELDRNYTFTIGLDESLVNGIVIDGNFTIKGNGFTINALNQSRIFNITGQKTILTGITFINAFSTQGCAIYYDKVSSAVIEDCKFTDSTTVNGTIFFTGENLTIDNTEFINTSGSNNYYLESEQGNINVLYPHTVSFLYAVADGNVNITRSKFMNSTFSDMGIGIEGEANVTFDDNLFANNLAYAAKYSMDDEGNIFLESYFYGFPYWEFFSEEEYGCVLIWINASNVEMYNSNFINNTVGYLTEIIADNITVNRFAVADSHMVGAIAGLFNTNFNVTGVEFDNVSSKFYTYYWNEEVNDYIYTYALNSDFLITANSNYVFDDYDVTLTSENIIIRDISIKDSKELPQSILMVMGNDVILDNLTILNSQVNANRTYWDYESQSYVEVEEGSNFEGIAIHNVRNAYISNITIDNSCADSFQIIYIGQMRGNASIDTIKISNFEIGGDSSVISGSGDDSIVKINNIMLNNITSVGNVEDYGDEIYYSRYSGVTAFEIYNIKDIIISNVSINNTSISKLVGIMDANNVEINTFSVDNTQLFMSEYSMGIMVDGNVILENINYNNITIAESVEYEIEDGLINYYTISNWDRSVAIQVFTQNGDITLKDISMNDIESTSFNDLISLNTDGGDILADNITLKNIVGEILYMAEYNTGLRKFIYDNYTGMFNNGLRFKTADGKISISNLTLENYESAGYELSDVCLLYVFSQSGDVILENINIKNTTSLSYGGYYSMFIFANNDLRVNNFTVDNLRPYHWFNHTYNDQNHYITQFYSYSNLEIFINANSNANITNLIFTNIRLSNEDEALLKLLVNDLIMDNVFFENITGSEFIEGHDFGNYLEYYKTASQAGCGIIVHSSNAKISNIFMNNIQSNGQYLLELTSSEELIVDTISITNSTASNPGILMAGSNLTLNNFVLDNVSSKSISNTTNYDVRYQREVSWVSSYYSYGFNVELQAVEYVNVTNAHMANIIGGNGYFFSIISEFARLENVSMDNITPPYYMEEWFDGYDQIYMHRGGEVGSGLYVYSSESELINVELNNIQFAETYEVLVISGQKTRLENVSIVNASHLTPYTTQYYEDYGEYITEYRENSFSYAVNIMGRDINITGFTVDNVPSGVYAVYMYGDVIMIDNSSFRNIASGYEDWTFNPYTHESIIYSYCNEGIGISLEADNITVSNTVFENIDIGTRNDNDFAALMIDAYVSALIDNCTFRNINLSSIYYELTGEYPVEYEYYSISTYGAAITFTSNGDNDIVNSSFINCSADYGGAIYTTVPVSIIGSEFINNSAIYGGAIYVRGSKLLINDTLFQENTAVDGGALFFDENSYDNTIYNATFLKNLAEKNGGAVYVYESTVENGVNIINASNFTSNHANYNGGGFFFNDTINQIVWDDYRWNNGIAEGTRTFISEPLQRTMILFGEFKDNTDYTLNITAHNTAAGGNHTVTITIDEVATGFVYVNITDSQGNFIQDIDGDLINGYYPLENGQVTLRLAPLPIGDYNVSAYYDDWDYNEILYYHEASIIFTVYPHDLNITVNKTIYADENLTVIAELNNHTVGTVNITVSNDNTTLRIDDIPVVNGTMKHDISGLYAGEYNITVTYNGDDLFYPKSNTTSFTVLKRSSTIIDVRVEGTVYTNTTRIIVEVPENQTGNVTININSQNMTKEVTSGIVEFEVENLTVKEWNVTVTFNENRVYDESSTSLLFNITKANLTANAVGENVTVNDNASFIIDVPNDFKGNVTITIDDKTYYDGPVSERVNIQALPAGEYTANISFYGDDNYNDTIVETNFTISPVEPEMNVTITNATYGGNATATINISGNANGTVNITVDDKTYTGTVENGRATVQLDNVSAGEKVAEVKFITSDKYNSNTTATATFNVAKNTPTILISNTNTTITVDVKDNATGDVIVIVNGEEYIKLLVNGQISIEDVLVSNTNSIVVIYNGDGNYNATRNATKITLPYKVTVYDVISDENRVIINVTGISSGNVTVIVDNNQTIMMNLSTGNAIFNITGLSKDLHIINVISPSGSVDEIEIDGRGSPVISVLTIKSEDMTRGYHSPYDYRAVFLDNEGNALINTQVIFKVKDTEYKVTTDKEGVAQLVSTLAVGKYNITSINPLTGEQATNQVEIVKRILENKDLTMDFNDGSVFKVKVIGDDGKIAKQGEIIDITANGVHYVGKVDKNGYASIKINLLPKTYKVTAEFKGYKTTNKVVVKQVLKAVKKTTKVKKGKKIVLKAKLVWSNGKGIKGKVIKFKFKGKTYKAKTNAKGIAKVTIKKKKVLKKLKKGKKYTVKVTYSVKYKYGNGSQTINDNIKMYVKIK